MICIISCGKLNSHLVIQHWLTQTLNPEKTDEYLSLDQDLETGEGHQREEVI